MIRLVQIHISDPVFIQRRNQELELIKQLSHLELLLAKIDRLEVWKSNGGLRSADPTLKQLYQIVSRIQSDVQPQIISRKDTTFIDKWKLHYPRALSLLLKTSPSASSDDGQQSLSRLNVLYVIAARLYHDLSLSSHQYVAYQLALLYQCISKHGILFNEYKVRIGQRFDEIKQTVATHNLLETDQISWYVTFRKNNNNKIHIFSFFLTIENWMIQAENSNFGTHYARNR
ncbi:MAG: hypothetical protein EXX96DRAFT_533953 [Benjaminiella poitrasii]|nr:MAG: hypothetical protein EXX96DRAFT_533953 [Benjaminiella poitrasii]